MPDIQLIDQQLFDEVAAQAKSSTRQRMNHNFHSSPEANPHRFLNVLLKDTYIRPHRHLEPPKSEAFLVLEGCADILVFDESGSIKRRYRLGREGERGRAWGIDLPPGVWHTIVAVTDRVVCYEVKPGPWEPSSDKEFAQWAPKEGEPEAAEFLERWRA